MINYILFWDNDELLDNDNMEKVHIQQRLAQKSWELRKIYDLPEPETNEEVPKFIVQKEKFPMEYKNQEIWKKIIDDISLYIGNDTEWRFLLFIASEKKPLEKEYDYIKQFLAQMMYYNMNDNEEVSAGLTCELPEQIWLITLKDTNCDDSILYYNDMEREDENIYAVYPPNCRFLCYELDYRKENYFDSEMLKMHCSIRCLARSILPADMIKGNQMYCLKTEWDEKQLYIEINQYEVWLKQIEKRITTIKKNITENRLEDFEIPKWDENDRIQKRENNKLNEKRPKEIVEKVENMLESANINARVEFDRYKEQLKQYLEKQKGHILSKSRRFSLKENMYKEEQAMYQKYKGFPFKNLLYNIINQFLQIKHFFIFGTQSNKKEQKQNFEQEIEYLYNLNQKMSQEFWSSIFKAFIQIISCFFMFYLAADNMEIINLYTIPSVIWGTGICAVICIVVYLILRLVYSGWHKCLCQIFYHMQKRKLKVNKKYFLHLMNYFRLRYILNFSKEQQKQKSLEEEMYNEWLQEWKKYNEICNQFKISFGKRKDEPMEILRYGNIHKMLVYKQNRKLYSLSTKMSVLNINGSNIHIPFAFMKKIKLEKIYNISQKS